MKGNDFYGKLSECPFCGETILDSNDITKWNVRFLAGDYNALPEYFVQCPRCDARGPRGKGMRSAVYLWNRRGPQATCGSCEYWGGSEGNNVCLYDMRMEKFYDREKPGGYVMCENDHCKNYREKLKENN